MPELFGRQAVLRGIERYLAQPECLSVPVVGPRGIGKTVLLQRLLTEVVGPGKPFTCGAYVDFRQVGAISNTADFWRPLLAAIRAAVLPVFAELADLIDVEDPKGLPANIEDLGVEGHRLLVVLDGLDPALTNPNLSPNTLDLLRDLGQRSCLRYVTGSRSPLIDLCLDQASRTSPFFNIFRGDVIVPPYGDSQDRRQ